MKTIVIKQNGRVLFPRIGLADSFGSRFWGLMGEKKLADGEGVLLLGCSAIHTCFMRFAIDVIYLDKNFRVLKCETVLPWRIGSFVKDAKNVLEIPVGAGKELIRGEPIEVVFKQ